MAEALPVVDAATIASHVDVGCKPGEAGHTAAPCSKCEQIRERVAIAIDQGVRAAEANFLRRVEGAARARLDATNAWASVAKDNERLRTAFEALRVVFDLDPSEAGRIAHEAWIGQMLAAGYHPFTECPDEQGCPRCDHELMRWEELPTARRLVREAGVTALFTELRQRARLDEIDQARRAAAEELARIRTPEAKAPEPP